MYGVNLVYTSEQSKKMWERLEKLGQRFEKYLKSLASDQIEELMRKAVRETYPHLPNEQAEACIAREMGLVADRGGFSAYIEEDRRIKARLLANIPTEPWRSAPSDRDGASGSPSETDVDHPASG